MRTGSINSEIDKGVWREAQVKVVARYGKTGIGGYKCVDRLTGKRRELKVKGYSTENVRGQVFER